MPWRCAENLARHCFETSFRQGDRLSQRAFPLQLRARTTAGSFVLDELEAFTPVPTTVELP